jgi:hypothetical protein
VNTFSAATVAELPLVRDDEVSRRVRAHVEFAFTLGGLAQRARTPPTLLVAPLKIHEDVLVSTLEADIKESPLPEYHPLPTGDI